MTEVKRRYDSTRRRARAALTNERMVDAAARLFAERGYVATTVEAIARAAGVSPQTFYAAFGSKRGVLFELLDGMARRADAAALARAIVATSDPRAQLALLVEYRVRLYAGAARELEMLRAAMHVESDAAAVWAEGEERRRRNQAELLRSWHAAGVLRPGLSARRAGDILWALSGPDVYRLFVAERGWSLAAFGQWLVRDLEAQLFGE